MDSVSVRHRFDLRSVVRILADHKPTNRGIPAILKGDACVALEERGRGSHAARREKGLSRGDPWVASISAC